MHKLSLDQTPDQTVETQSTVSHVDIQSQNSNTGHSEYSNYSSNTVATPSMKKSPKAIILVSLIAIAAGVGTGFGGYKLQAKSGGPGLGGGQALQQVATGAINNGDIFGIQDEKTFKDSAEGYLEMGGVDGEGSHRLLRAGGTTQTVYLTSSVTDLDKFEGMEVKVWGETFKGQKAGWLMDVGRVQVVNTQGDAPVEE